MKLPWPLILASTSKYRGELLSQLGWPFDAKAPGVDEDEIKKIIQDPGKLAIELSRLKALSVFEKFPQSCVIGSDQVCSFGEEILGKPKTKQGAIDQLKKLQGSTHQLLTAVTVMNPETSTTFLNTTTLYMRALDPDEIIQYIEADNPLDCAGSYKLEARGIKLFEKIEMTDHTSIIGLPLIELSNVLIDLGYPV